MASARSLIKVALPQVPLDQRKAETIERLLRYGLGAFGVGAAARGALGLRDMMQQPPEAAFISPGPSVLPIPVPPEEEEEPATIPMQPKMAGDGPLAWLSQKLAPLISDRFMGGLMNTKNLTSTDYHPAARVGGLALAGAGAGGGWALTDWMLKRQQKSKRDAELAAAEQEYRQALEGGVGKLAGDTYAGLDELAKLAGVGTDTAAGVDTAWLATLLGLGGTAAYGAYNFTKSRSQAKLLDKAMKARQRKLWESYPQPIYAVPAPVEAPAAA